ncbi:hypothetical protein Tco_1551766, partial [Tanacetum coccineum]
GTFQSDRTYKKRGFLKGSRNFGLSESVCDLLLRKESTVSLTVGENLNEPRVMVDFPGLRVLPSLEVSPYFIDDTFPRIPLGSNHLEMWFRCGYLNVPDLLPILVGEPENSGSSVCIGVAM